MDMTTKQSKTEKCGFMILTPTPLHNGGMWCAEDYPCKTHGSWKENKTEPVTNSTSTKPNGWEEELSDIIHCDSTCGSEASEAMGYSVPCTCGAEAEFKAISKIIHQAILSAEKRAREEVYKLAKKILTEDISHAKFIDDGRKIWSVKGLKNRGIEPCYECENREKIVKFLQSLPLPDQEGLSNSKTDE